MKEYIERIHKSLLELLAIDSVESESMPSAPFGKGNRLVLDKTLALCRELGFETYDDEGYCGEANIGEGELFGILAHLDTVPIGENWTANPLGEIKDGYIYGRGVVDDKGPLVACLYAVRALLDEGKQPKRKIRFIMGCNEETGWKCVDHYFERHPKPKDAFSPDGDFPVVYCEKGVVNFRITFKKPRFIRAIKGGERANVVPASCEFSMSHDCEELELLFENCIDVASIEDADDITVHFAGVASHGSHPELGENAITKALRVLANMTDDMLPIYDRLNDTDGLAMGIKSEDEVSGALTLNVGTIKDSGDNIEIVVDIRYPMCVTKEELLAQFRTKLPFANVEITHYHDPLYVPKTDELVVKLTEAYNEVTGEQLEPIFIGGGTYARALPHAVAFGPTFPDEDCHIHDKDERMSLSSFYNMCRVYKRAIEKLCF